MSVTVELERDSGGKVEFGRDIGDRYRIRCVRKTTAKRGLTRRGGKDVTEKFHL